MLKRFKISKDLKAPKSEMKKERTNHSGAKKLPKNKKLLLSKKHKLRFRLIRIDFKASSRILPRI